MSVPEPCIDSSIDDILAALEVRLDIEEAIAQLPVTQALEKCLLFAQAHNLIDLEKLVKQELDGYQDELPSDRIVQLNYFDNGGQIINGLDQYRAYPLTIGVRKLELHLKNGLTLMLPKQILNFLSKAAGREVESGHISPAEIHRFLGNIRDLVSHKIKMQRLALT
jgi:hypothetical protein